MKKIISIFLCFTIVVTGFCVLPLSASGEDTIINIEDIPRDWTGEYDGHAAGISPLRRNLNIYINRILSDGSIYGSALIFPSELEDEDLGVNGKYTFSGKIDLSTGEITLQGNKWTEYPGGTYPSNFSFATFVGVIDLESKTISGTSNDGIWRMSEINYDDYSSDNGFRLTVDNNSFIHFNNIENEMDGFKGLTDYHIDDEYFQELVRGPAIPSLTTMDIEVGEILFIKFQMNSPWNGSCHGIASTMGLLFYGQIDIDYLSDTGGINYYNLPLPCDDRQFMNVINYYQLSQYLFSKAPPLASISTTYNSKMFGLPGPYGILYESKAVFLKTLVDSVVNDGIKMFSYSYFDDELELHGHVILAVNCKYDEEKNQYVITMYDENSVTNEFPRGQYTNMYINNDFSGFSYTTPDEKTITSDNFVSLELSDFQVVNDISNIPSGSSSESENTEEDNHIRLAISMTDNFRMYDDKGNYLACSENGLIGYIGVRGVDTVVDNENSKIIVDVDESTYLKFEEISDSIEIQVYDNNDFMSLSASKIDEFLFSFEENKIDISGDDYTFEAYISVDQEVAENENGLVSFSGDATSDVTIEANDSGVKVVSDEVLENVVAESFVGTDVYTLEYEEASNEYDFSIDYREGKLIRGLQSGDVNGDNRISALDAFCVLREIAGYESLISFQTKLGDVTGDEKISSQDALEILRYSAGFNVTSNVGKVS